ncbi:protein INCA1 isoform X3 [Erinaceus europaeus]|uniref:Protein INCA1 isoform X3 n=1 Tax=Erinaceus europaeus TaxID=9365 RepID=A0ABM3YGP6_ERIEU|nr:protein INCA1 isoform X3 [Erinaceus europaeus]
MEKDRHLQTCFTTCEVTPLQHFPEAIRKFSPALQPCPAMQFQEDGDNHIPFANPAWMEEQYIPPWLPGVYRPEGLPPPEMLCRRKRRRSHLSAVQQAHGGIPARVRAVTYHLEDLRRRQRNVNELKKTQWGSSGPASEPLVLGKDGCGSPSTSQYSHLEEERATTKEDYSLPPGRAQLLWSPWSPLGQEGSCVSGQLSSLAPYSTVTAYRNCLYNPGGMELQPEE